MYKLDNIKAFMISNLEEEICEQLKAIAECSIGTDAYTSQKHPGKNQDENDDGNDD